MDAATVTKENFRGSSDNSGANFSQGGNYISSQNQSDVGRILNRTRQSGAGNTGDKLKQPQKGVALSTDVVRTAEGDPSTTARLAKLALGMFRQIRPADDWPYLCLLLPLAFLKDIFDIAFAAIPGVGIIFSFITTLFLAITTIIFLILIGEKMSSGKSGKYFAGLAVEFISEILPGIGWLPLAFIQTLVIYFFVLFDRTANYQDQKEQVTDQSESQ